MANLIFHGSKELTLGAELELQLINPANQALISRAKELIRQVRHSRYKDQIKPEITQSMIELNSSVHSSPQTLYEELLELGAFLTTQSEKLDVQCCGGGTHPFQPWSVNKIFPTLRFKNLSYKYRYLSKRFTVFALHFHIGCQTGNDAIYLTHTLARYAPHFIALSASSPFYQGVDTKYDSSRVNVVNAFPTSGNIPFVLDWKDFSTYYLKMRKLKIINSMKDFYWDIRPKPTYGTVEVRVCDMPLTLLRAICIIAYAQTLAKFLLTKKPFPLTDSLYQLYNYNRFQACRYGFEGIIIDPFTLEKRSIADDILMALKEIKTEVKSLNTSAFLRKIYAWVNQQQNDAKLLRLTARKYQTLEKVVQFQCKLWDTQF